MKIDHYISYIILMVLLVSSIGVIYTLVNNTPSERFTEFYLLGPEGKAGDYPTNLTIGENGTLIIGIVNREATSSSYELVVKLNNKTIKQESLKLQDKEKREINFTFTPNQTGNNQKIQFYLYKLPDNQNSYRFLELVINVGGNL